jgi:hypothetical protein
MYGLFETLTIKRVVGAFLEGTTHKSEVDSVIFCPDS